MSAAAEKTNATTEAHELLSIRTVCPTRDGLGLLKGFHARPPRHSVSRFAYVPKNRPFIHPHRETTMNDKTPAPIATDPALEIEPETAFIPTPAHLNASGAALFAAAVDSYELSLPELAALLQAAETIDTLRVLEDAIRVTGPVVNNRPSPLLAEARQQRATLVRLLGVLDLRLDEDETPDAVRLSTSRAARKAARVRWDRVSNRREA